jgi:hypothetical protein
MGEAFTRHSLRPLDVLEGMSIARPGAIRRGNAMACLVWLRCNLACGSLGPSFRGARNASELGIHFKAEHEAKWIPGSSFGRPGTTTESFVRCSRAGRLMLRCVMAPTSPFFIDSPRNRYKT